MTNYKSDNESKYNSINTEWKTKLENTKNQLGTIVNDFDSYKKDEEKKHKDLQSKYDNLLQQLKNEKSEVENKNSELTSEFEQYKGKQQNLYSTLQLEYDTYKTEATNKLNAKPTEIEIIKEVPVEVIKEVEVTKEVEVIKEVPVEVKVTQKSKSVNKKEIKKDPLTKIEGIGPAIQKLLYADGILTFAQLSKASKNRLVEILEGGGSRFRMHNPSTWPQQSKLAAKGKWTELKSLQDKLDGGKK